MYVCVYVCVCACVCVFLLMLHRYRNALALLSCNVSNVADDRVEAVIRGLLEEIKGDHLNSVKTAILTYVLRNPKERLRYILSGALLREVSHLMFVCMVQVATASGSLNQWGA